MDELFGGIAIIFSIAATIGLAALLLWLTERSGLIGGITRVLLGGTILLISLTILFWARLQPLFPHKRIL